MPEGQKLVSTQFRLVYPDGKSEDLEFTASTTEAAVQAIVDRWHLKGTPLKQVVAADGREWNVTDA